MTRWKRKNSSRFDMDVFKQELREARRDFFVETQRMNGWLEQKQMPLSDVKELIESIVKSERKAEKMTSLYFTEAATRGPSTCSRCTQRSPTTPRMRMSVTASSSRTQATTHSRSQMWKREQEVNKWISSGPLSAVVASCIAVCLTKQLGMGRLDRMQVALCYQGV